MTEKQRELDELIRKSIRPMRGCRCMDAMLEGFRKPYCQDDGCMHKEEPQQERKAK